MNKRMKFQSVTGFIPTYILPILKHTSSQRECMYILCTDPIGSLIRSHVTTPETRIPSI